MKIINMVMVTVIILTGWWSEVSGNDDEDDDEDGDGEDDGSHWMVVGGLREGGTGSVGLHLLA